MSSRSLQRIVPGVLGLVLLAAAPLAFAEDTLSQGDTAWILTATALVLFMTIPGLSLFYARLVRSKNSEPSLRASGFVGPAGALVFGTSAGLICFLATNYLKRKLKIDDTLDVFPVHGVAGILGTLLTAVFASKALGIFSRQEELDVIAQLGVQATGIVATLAYTIVGTFIILKVVDMLVGRRSRSNSTQRARLRSLVNLCSSFL